MRSKRSITQKELAQRLHCTDKAVSRWETGKGFPDVSLLIPLARELDVTVNELLIGENIQAKEAPQKSEMLIVETIDKAKRQSKKLSYVIFALICIIQLLAFYIVPASAQPGDEMGVVFIIVAATLMNSFFAGLINSKIRFSYPLYICLTFIPSIYIFYNADTDLYLYAAGFFAASSVIICIQTGIRRLVMLCRQRQKH